MRLYPNAEQYRLYYAHALHRGGRHAEAVRACEVAEAAAAGGGTAAGAAWAQLAPRVLLLRAAAAYERE